MGDRGNVVVLSQNYRTEGWAGVWIYSHWGGSRLEESVKKALAGVGKNRIGDEMYLTRIIFCQIMVDEWMSNGKNGLEAISELTADMDNDEELDFLRSVIDSFMSETGYGIGVWGAGDQNNPTVCVDADTGEVWLDHECPETTEEVVANRAKANVTVSGLGELLFDLMNLEEGLGSDKGAEMLNQAYDMAGRLATRENIG